MDQTNATPEQHKPTATATVPSPFDYDWSIKYIIIGDMGTGKSCILQRFIQQKFLNDLPHTIGPEFGTRCIQVEDAKLKLQIWDTAGQERFRSITKSYYRGSAGCIVVYDISRRSTYTHVTNWLSDARASTNSSCVITLIGNKTDLEAQREVSYEEALQFARDNNLLFAEASAKEGDAVEETFAESSRRIYGLVKSGTIDPTQPDSGVQRKRSHHLIEDAGRNTYGYGGGNATLAAMKSKSNCTC